MAMNSDHFSKFVENLPFLQYENAIQEVQFSHIDFPIDTKSREPKEYSEFGIDVVKKFLHVGLVKETANPRVLLIVWPSFISPTDYRIGEQCPQILQKVKLMIFLVPEEVFDQYSNGIASKKAIIIAVALLRPKTEWIFLERELISAFYHLVFDETNDVLYGNKDVWDNYSIDQLDATWKYILFLCYGPRNLAYQIKKLLKRNWAKIAKNAVSTEINVEKDYVTVSQGDLLYLLVLWSRFSVNHGALLMFLKNVNSERPAFNPPALLQLTKFSFAIHVARSKRYRCTQCVYETNKRNNFDEHIVEHEDPNTMNMYFSEMEEKPDEVPMEYHHSTDVENEDNISHEIAKPTNRCPEEYDLETDNETDFELLSTQESVRSLPKVRRSRRVTENALKEYADQVLYSQIITGSNELLVDVFMDPIKGRGCRAAKDFVRNEFVLEYKGKLLDRKEAVELEEKYANDYNIGSFMYFFTHKNKQFCLDATEETPYKARLINHSFIKPNLKVKLVELCGRPYLVLRAARNISFGEELLFNYGEKRADIVKENPWLLSS